MEIVSTLLRLAAERNPSDITTGEIAKAMHLTQGALFKHFSSKEAIRLAGVQWIEETIMGMLEEARRGAANPLSALHDMFMAHVAFAARYPGAPRLIFGELQEPDFSPVKGRVRQILQGYRQLIAQALEEAIAAGLVRPDADRPAAAALFLGAIQGLVIQAMVTGKSEPMLKEAESVFTLYLHGLLVRP